MTMLSKTFASTITHLDLSKCNKISNETVTAIAVNIGI
jgi:hypothetical protein